DQILIGLEIPGTDKEAPLTRQALEPLGVLGTDFEVVLKHDGLAIKHEMSEAGVGLQCIEHLVNGADEPHAELLERQIPLAVPMGMGHDEEANLCCHATSICVVVRASPCTTQPYRSFRQYSSWCAEAYRLLGKTGRVRDPGPEGAGPGSGLHRTSP